MEILQVNMKSVCFRRDAIQAKRGPGLTEESPCPAEIHSQVGIFFTSLPLTKAFTIYDEQEAITARNFIPPSFNDIRHVLNIAQLFALRKTVKLITFDGASYRNLLLIAYQPCAEILYAIAQVTKRCIKMEEISIRTAP